MHLFASPYLSAYLLHVTTREMLNEFSWNLILWSLLKFVNTFQFCLLSDNNNRYFTWSPACSFAYESDLGGSPNSQALCPYNYIGESHNITTQPDTPAMQRSLTPDNSGITATIHKGKKNNIFLWNKQPPVTTHATCKRESQTGNPEAITKQTCQNCYTMCTFPTCFTV
jgi:hypothetical protein